MRQGRRAALTAAAWAIASRTAPSWPRSPGSRSASRRISLVLAALARRCSRLRHRPGRLRKASACTPRVVCLGVLVACLLPYAVQNCHDRRVSVSHLLGQRF